MNGAWSDYNHQSLLLVCAVDYLDGLGSSFEDGVPGLVCQCEFMLEEVGRGEGVVTEN